MMTSPRIRRLQRLDVSDCAFGTLWLLIFCIPWEEEVSVVQGLAVSHLVGAAASLTGVLCALIVRRVRKLHPAHYLLGALVVWTAASYFWSIAPDATVVKAGSCIQLLLMVWLIWEFAPTESRQVSLLAAYVLGSYVSEASVVYSFVTQTGKNLGLSEGRYTAAGFDENELGITLALALVMSCHLLARNGRYQFIWLVHIPMCLLAICLTGSRGAFVATGVAVIIFPLSFGYVARRNKPLILTALASLVGTALLVIPHTTWQRMGTIHSEVAEGTLTHRTLIWTAGLEVYRGHPIIGVGAGAFGASVYSRLDIPYVAHNSYLSILVELGAVGATIFLATLLASGYLIAHLPRFNRRAWLVLMSTWCVAVSSLTWEHRKPTWFLFGLLIAQSAAFRSRYQVPVVRSYRLSDAQADLSGIVVS